MRNCHQFQVGERGIAFKGKGGHLRYDEDIQIREQILIRSENRALANECEIPEQLVCHCRIARHGKLYEIARVTGPQFFPPPPPPQCA